jgi:microcystin-dependent protein
MEGTMAEIRMFAGNFAPLNWSLCYGQLMPIAPNTALFSLLGTTFGGDGIQSFALPDFRGRIPVGTGGGAGLSPYYLGQLSGVESITLISANLPPHTHALTGTVSVKLAGEDANLMTPAGNYFAPNGTNRFFPTSDGTTMKPLAGNLATSPNGQSLPVDNIAPVLAMNYVICLEGIYPSRN